MLSEVMLLPQEPQPCVIDGNNPVVSPTAAPEGMDARGPLYAILRRQAERDATA